MSQEYSDFIAQEELISLEDYTKDIIDAIIDIKHRMDCISIKHSDDDIKVIRHDNSIYILANPQLGIEPVFEDDEFVGEEPLYNITLMHLKFNMTPRVRIIMPELCTRLDYEPRI